MKRMKSHRLFQIAVLPLALLLRWASPVMPTVIEGHSMEPTLHPGGVYLLERRYYRSHPLCRGDVVVLRWGRETYVKRVYALPGDHLWLIRDPEAARDELLVPADAARLLRMQQSGRLQDQRVVSLTLPPGCCYVLGDNASVSFDSRDFGPVPESAILGRVLP